MQTHCEAEVNTETNPINDLELVRYLDGELEPQERSALDSRLAAAPDAAARLEQLRHRSRNLSELLRTAAPSGREARASAEVIRPLMTKQSVRFGWPPYLKAAAVVALLLMGAFAVPPARAWLLARLLDARAALGLGSAPSTTPIAAPAPPATGVSTTEVIYSFQVTSDTFSIEVLQTAGELIVERTSDSSASAELSGGEPGSLLVLPRGIRIEGPSTARTVYTISLPERVTVVRLERNTGVTLHTLRSGQPLKVDLSTR
jgi:hypothetical protein